MILHASHKLNVSRRSTLARRTLLLFLAISSAVMILDQLSKAWIASQIGPAQPDARINIVGTWVALEYSENRGAAFGLLVGLGPLLMVASVAIVGFLLFILFRAADPPWWQAVAIGGIVGGAAGNLIDRVRLGYVVDFLAIGVWPNFNVADSAITLGIVLSIWGGMLAGTGRNQARLP